MLLTGKRAAFRENETYERRLYMDLLIISFFFTFYEYDDGGRYLGSRAGAPKNPSKIGRHLYLNSNKIFGHFFV